MRWQTGLFQLTPNRLSQELMWLFVADLGKKVLDHLSVAKGPVAVLNLQVMPFDEFVQVMFFLLGEKRPRKFQGTENIFLEGDLEAAKFTFQETIIKTGVMGD